MAIKLLNTLIVILLLAVITANAAPAPQHFKKILVVIFENMNYDMIKDEPVFNKLVAYTGHELDREGKLYFAKSQTLNQDPAGNHYALFTQYYNNHLGGAEGIRPSQPNYIAMISGSTYGIHDDERHNLTGDNLANELNEKGVTWKVYAENMPDPRPEGKMFTSANTLDESVYQHITPYLRDPSLTEEQNGYRSHQYYLKQYATLQIPLNMFHRSGCFDEAAHGTDGYARKHEPFISFKTIQGSRADCTRIVNASHLAQDIRNLADVTFYIPNLKHDGHNGSDSDRTKHANLFLAAMMGLNPTNGNVTSTTSKAPFQQLMAQNGLLVITFDEPSKRHNPGHTIYTMLAGKMLKSGAYPDAQNNQIPLCYPPLNEQTKYPADKNGQYHPYYCNHYNLLKMIEDNWQLRGLNPTYTSTGYKYAYPLGHGINGFWR